MISRILYVFLASLTVIAGEGNGAPFVNLNFEQATIKTATPNYSVSTAVLFPGWTLFYGTAFGSTAEYGGVTVDGSSIAVLYSNYVHASQAINGNYSVSLQKRAYGASMLALTQTGDVPISARSLRFTARDETQGYYDNDFPGLLKLTLNGQLIPLVALSRIGYDVQYAADVSAFANQTVALSIGVSGEPVTPQNPYGYGYAGLDDFHFSSQPVPEGCMLSLGSICLLLRRRRNHVLARV